MRYLPLLGQAVVPPATAEPMRFGVAEDNVFTSGGQLDNAATVARFNQFETDLGSPVTVMRTFCAYQQWTDVPSTFLSSGFQGQWKRQQTATRRLNIGVPMNVQANGNGNTSGLQEVANGLRDSVFTQLFQHLVDNSLGDSYLDVGWEFSGGNWYPWNGDVTPSVWIAAQRRIVDLARAITGQSFIVLWTMNPTYQDPSRFYPGDAYVDSIGMDRYGWKWGNGVPTWEELRSFVRSGETYSMDWTLAFAKEHNKTWHMSEWANVTTNKTAPANFGRGDEPLYIDLVFDWAEEVGPYATATPGLGCRFLCYYNVPDGGVETTLASTPNSYARLKQRLGVTP